MPDPFYSTKEWRELRAFILERDPVCRTPGCERPSTHVDHLLARERGGSDHPDNLAGKCDSCHNRKTAMRDGGFGNKRTEGRVALPGCDVNGLPIDPGHWWHN